MSDNKTLLQKADVVVGDLAAGGLLTTEQSNAFIRKLLVQPTLLSASRVVTMNSPKREVNKIQFASRILREGSVAPQVSGSPMSVGNRAKPEFSKITLDAKEVIAEVHIPYDVIEDNIERGGVSEVVPSGPGSIGGGIKDTIMTLIAERAALDLEELAILGDTGSGDTYLAQMDGYLKLASANVSDNLNGTIEKGMFKNATKTMPDQYLRNRAALRHYVSVDNETEYRDTLSDRQTGLGDSLIQGRNAVFAYGTPIVPVALMPEDQSLMTDPQNLLFGIQRRIHIETDKDIRSRVYIIVLTARVDFKIEEADALVKTINIGS